MGLSALVRRTIALALLLVLPTVTGASLVLDASSWSEVQHIEAAHSVCCYAAHDHRLCLLVFQTPWSSAEAPRLTSQPHLAGAQVIGEHVRDLKTTIELTTARSPPILI